MLESQKQYDIIEEKTHKSLDKIVQVDFFFSLSFFFLNLNKKVRKTSRKFK